MLEIYTDVRLERGYISCWEVIWFVAHVVVFSEKNSLQLVMIAIPNHMIDL